MTKKEALVCLAGIILFAMVLPILNYLYFDQFLGQADSKLIAYGIIQFVFGAISCIFGLGLSIFTIGPAILKKHNRSTISQPTS